MKNLIHGFTYGVYVNEIIDVNDTPTRWINIIQMTLQRDLMKHLMIAFIMPTLIAFSFHEISIQFYTNCNKTGIRIIHIKVNVKRWDSHTNADVWHQHYYFAESRLLGSVSFHLDLRTRYERRTDIENFLSVNY